MPPVDIPEDGCLHSAECPECQDGDILCVTSSINASGTTVVECACTYCGYRETFRSWEVDTKYGDDGVTVTHGDHWPAIKANRDMLANERERTGTKPLSKKKAGFITFKRD